MEEFATEKIKKSKSETGRCDIIFRIGKNVFLGEAKQDWPRLTASNINANLREINRMLKQACRESLQTKDANAIHLGVVFVTPRIHERKKQLLDGLLKDYLNKLNTQSDVILAWMFPKWSRDLHSSEPGVENYIYPGVILVIKRAN